MKNTISLQQLISAVTFFTEEGVNENVYKIDSENKLTRAQAFSLAYLKIKTEQYPGLTEEDFTGWIENPESIINLLEHIAQEKGATANTITPEQFARASVLATERNSSWSQALSRATKDVETFQSGVSIPVKTTKTSEPEPTTIGMIQGASPVSQKPKIDTYKQFAEEKKIPTVSVSTSPSSPVVAAEKTVKGAVEDVYEAVLDLKPIKEVSTAILGNKKEDEEPLKQEVKKEDRLVQETKNPAEPPKDIEEFVEKKETNKTTPVEVAEQKTPRTYIPAAKVERAVEAATILHTEAIALGPDNFINKYVPAAFSAAKSVSVGTSSSPVVNTERGIRLTVGRIYDAAINFNPLKEASDVIFSKNKPSDEVSAVVLNQKFEGLGKETLEVLQTPQKGAPGAISNEFLSTKSIQNLSTNPPEATIFSPLSLQVVAKDISKDEPKKATAIHMASIGYSNPEDVFRLKQIAEANGNTISDARLKELAALISEYNTSNVTVINKNIKLSPNETLLIATARNVDYGNIIGPGLGGIKGIALDIGKRLFGKTLKSAATKALAKTAVGAAAKKIGSAVVSKLTAAMGSVSGPVGAILGWVVGEILTRIVGLLEKAWNKIKENWKEFFGSLLVIGGFASGAPIMAIGGFALIGVGPLILFFAGLGRMFFKSVVGPTLGVILGLPVGIALIMFIINSGAYVVPPQTGSISVGTPGELGPTCPSGYPVQPENGETSLQVVQGPHGGESHRLLEAVDFFGQTGWLANGHVVRSTHSGTVRRIYTEVGFDINDSYGKLVEIEGNCEGVPFITYYAHLSVIEVNQGDTVAFGAQIGLSGDTGPNQNPHLHYEMRPGDNSVSNPPGSLHYPNNPPFMAPPYFPVLIPTACSNYKGPACNIRIP